MTIVRTAMTGGLFLHFRKRLPAALRGDERGVALLLTIFVIALATILVVDFGRRTRFEQRASRSFAEGVQAEYVLKSGLNLSRMLLEIPKLEGIREDWLGEPWAIIGAAPSLPISGVAGEPRMMIVDEEGKIDLNSVAIGTSAASGPYGQLNPNPTAGTDAASDPTLYWKNSLRQLFEMRGFVREQYNQAELRTPGNVGFDAGNQVAVLGDWIDADKNSYNLTGFDGQGIESSAPELFANRQLKSLSEALLVPGITLERLQAIAPYVRVSSGPAIPGAKKINVNTAPLPVLLAIGFPENQALEIVQQRTNLPVTAEMLNTITTGDQQLAQHTKVTSSEFSVYCRVVMPNSTRWLHAIIGAYGLTRRVTNVKFIEFY